VPCLACILRFFPGSLIRHPISLELRYYSFLLIQSKTNLGRHPYLLTEEEICGVSIIEHLIVNFPKYIHLNSPSSSYAMCLTLYRKTNQAIRLLPSCPYARREWRYGPILPLLGDLHLDCVCVCVPLLLVTRHLSTSIIHIYFILTEAA
jgi:hypothetical protein